MQTDQKIKQLIEWDMEKFDDKEKYFYFKLDFIEKHIPELKELKENNDPHLLAEIADLYILSKMLMIANNVGDDILEKRIERFREKISACREQQQNQ